MMTAGLPVLFRVYLWKGKNQGMSRREGPGESGPLGVGNALSEVQFASGLISTSISVDTNMIYAPWQFDEPFSDSTRPIWAVIIFHPHGITFRLTLS
jgi:hypothetical protein